MFNDKAEQTAEERLLNSNGAITHQPLLLPKLPSYLTVRKEYSPGLETSLRQKGCLRSVCTTTAGIGESHQGQLYLSNSLLNNNQHTTWGRLVSLWKTENNARVITQASPDVTRNIWRIYMHNRDIFSKLLPPHTRATEITFLGNYNTLQFIRMYGLNMCPCCP